MNIIGTRLQVMRGTAKQTGGGLMKKDLIYNKYNKIVSKKISMKYSKKFGKIMKGGGERFDIKDFTIESIINNKRSIEINTKYYKPLIKELEINFDGLESPIKIYGEYGKPVIETNNYSIDEKITFEFSNMKFIITLQDEDFKKILKQDEDFKKILNNKIKAIHKQVNQTFKSHGYETIYRLKSYKDCKDSKGKEVKSNLNTLYIASIKKEEGKKKVCILSIDNTNITKINKLEEIEINNIEDLVHNYNVNSNSYKTLLKFNKRDVYELNFDTQSNKTNFQLNFIKNNTKNIFPGINSLLS